MYSSEAHQLLYQYHISLAYITDGNLSIVARYNQGFQEVSYAFDKKLLLGFAIDIFGQSTTP